MRSWFGVSAPTCCVGSTLSASPCWSTAILGSVVFLPSQTAPDILYGPPLALSKTNTPRDLSPPEEVAVMANHVAGAAGMMYWRFSYVNGRE